MPYTKYIHIKESTKSSKKTMEGVDDYIDDDDKTVDKKPEKGEQIEAANRSNEVNSMQDISDYIENDMKTVNPKDMQHLVGVINCDKPEDFVSVCDESKKYYRERKTERLNPGQSANEGYHIIFSCKGKDLDPELVYHAGLDIARELAGSDFAAKVCTHLNTDNWHSHIAICAYSLPGLYPHKFKDEWRMIQKIRRISDEVSLRYGFEIIIPGLTDKKNWAEYLEGRADWSDVKSVMTAVKSDIRNASDAANNMDHFKQLMRDAGYELIEKSGRITYIKEGTVVSDYRLGSRYSMEGISEQIEKRKDRESKQLITRELIKAAPKINRTASLGNIYVPKYTDKGIRIPAIIRLLLYIKKCVEHFGNTFFDVSMEQAFPDNLRTQSPEKKLKAIDKAIDLCQKYDIRTLGELKARLQKIGAEAKSKDYEAERYFSVAGAMEDAVSALKIADKLKTVMTSLGIEDEDFKIKAVSREEVKFHLASLDPLSGKLKKQLYNALNGSKYRLSDHGFSYLTRTEGEAILDFLNKKTDKRPSVLLSQEEFAVQKAKENLSKIADNKFKNLEERYGSFPASESQVKTLKMRLPGELPAQIQPKNLSRADAIRLISKYTKDPLREILSSPQNKNDPVTSWQTSVLQNLQITNSEHFKDLNIENLDKKSANRIIDHELSRYDDIEDLILKKQNFADNKNQKSTGGIQYDKHTEEEKLCIVEYKHLLDVKAKFGLDTPEKAQNFLSQYDSLLTRASEAAEQSRIASEAYRDLNYLNSLIKNVTSKAFAFGQRYGGSDAEFTESITKISEDRLEDLQTMRSDIEKAIVDLSSHSLCKSDIRSISFEPLDPAYRSLLTEIKRYFPEYFISVSKPLTKTTDADAYDILTKIKSDKAIEKAVQVIQEQDKMEDIEKDKKRQSNERRM